MESTGRGVAGLLGCCIVDYQRVSFWSWTSDLAITLPFPSRWVHLRFVLTLHPDANPREL